MLMIQIVIAASVHRGGKELIVPWVSCLHTEPAIDIDSVTNFLSCIS